MKKNISLKIKKYLPDILIFFGVLIFSYNYFRPFSLVCVSGGCNSRFSKYDPSDYIKDYHTGYKVLGIMLITAGIIFAIRRYLAKKELKKN